MSSEQDDPQQGADAANQPLQFDRAEFTAPQDPGTAAPPQVAGAGQCSRCNAPLVDVYYAANQHVFCARCHADLIASISRGSRLGRFFKAFIYGLVAAFVGTLIWFGIRKATGYEIGLVAIVVGVMVGSAVRAGSNRRGGIGYQLLAVFLTYSSITANYVPDVYSAITERLDAKKSAQVSHAHPATTQSAAVDDADTTADADTVDANEHGEKSATVERLKSMGFVGAILGLIILVALLFAFAAVMPMLAGAKNIIGLLIIGFALWEAWKLNRAARLSFTGPHPIGGAPPPLQGFGQ